MPFFHGAPILVTATNIQDWTELPRHPGLQVMLVLVMLYHLSISSQSQVVFCTFVNGQVYNSVKMHWKIWFSPFCGSFKCSSFGWVRYSVSVAILEWDPQNVALGWRSDRFVSASPLGFPISCLCPTPPNKTEYYLLPTVARAIVSRVRSVRSVCSKPSDHRPICGSVLSSSPWRSPLIQLLASPALACCLSIFARCSLSIAQALLPLVLAYLSAPQGAPPSPFPPDVSCLSLPPDSHTFCGPTC